MITIYCLVRKIGHSSYTVKTLYAFTPPPKLEKLGAGKLKGGGNLNDPSCWLCKVWIVSYETPILPPRTSRTTGWKHTRWLSTKLTRTCLQCNNNCQLLSDTLWYAGYWIPLISTILLLDLLTTKWLCFIQLRLSQSCAGVITLLKCFLNRIF